MSRRRRWSDLSDRTRKLIQVGAAIEGALKIAALIDLWRRPTSQVRGSKARWAAAIVILNSAGVVPVSYFLRGRRTATDDA
jgi:hypothetical protein